MNANPLTQPFLEALAARRWHLKLTNLQVAQIAGLSEATVSRAMNGTGEPHFSTVAAIATALDMPLLIPEVTQ